MNSSHSEQITDTLYNKASKEVSMNLLLWQPKSKHCFSEDFPVLQCNDDCLWYHWNHIPQRFEKWADKRKLFIDILQLHILKLSIIGQTLEIDCTKESEWVTSWSVELWKISFIIGKPNCYIQFNRLINILRYFAIWEQF